MHLYQITPVHGHPYPLDKPLTGKSSLFRIKDIPVEFSIEKAMYQKSDTKAIATVPVPDPESGLLLGFIGVSWTTKKIRKEEVVVPFLTATGESIQNIIKIPTDAN